MGAEWTSVTVCPERIDQLADLVDRLPTATGTLTFWTVKVRMTYSARGSVSIRVTLMSP